jgi:phenol 2-monooxygenase
MEISAESNEYPVKSVLQHVDSQETEIVHSKYVVGADGAHSWVRKAFDIPMVGEQTNYIWGVVDLVPDTDFPDIRNRTAIHSNNGSCMVIPREGDKVRLYIQLDEKSGLLNEAGRIDKGKATPEHLLDIARKSMHPYKIATPDKFEWWTLYIIGQRVASSFSVDDRVFIVGDACHTHSPKAGQGMNASMGDSHNLAWKLTQVLRGWSDKRLLETYSFERKKYAEDLINFDKQFASLFSGKPRTEDNQDGVSHADFLKIFQTFGGFTSGIGIHYADSLITRSKLQSSAQHLTVGQRILPQIFLRAADFRPEEIQDLLPSDGCFKILVFTGDSAVPSQLQKIREVADAVEQTLGALALECGVGQIHAMFKILGISAASKLTVRYNELPELFRAHWSQILIDDFDVTGKKGGDGYKNYGVGSEGAIVVVRPDGYVGLVGPFDLRGVSELGDYFKAFMKA